MKIKIPHILLASGLLISTLNVSAATVSFTDVAPSAWYAEAVDNVSENGWMIGTGNSSFTPNSDLNRAMLATVLWRIEGSPAPNGSVNFTDTDSASWYAEGLAWSTENGLFTGYPDGSFRPMNAITREQLATVFYRTAEDKTTVGDSKVSTTNGCVWAAEACAWANAHGLFTGALGTLDMCAPASRAEIAYWLDKYYSQKNETQITPTGSESNGGTRTGTTEKIEAQPTPIESGSDIGTEADTTHETETQPTPIESGSDTGTEADTTHEIETQSTLIEGLYDSMGYLLYTPANAQPDMPLIVYLHGGHGKGSDLSVLTTTDGFPQYLAEGKLGEIPAYVLIPQLPADKNGWKPSVDTVISLIDKICIENNIDRTRVSLTGHSMGGTGTWDIALLHPETFSRIAPMSGSIKTTQETLSALSDMPIWTFVGDADKVVKPESTEQFIEALQKQNTNAKLTVFADTDHVGVLQTAWLEDGAALIDWLIQ